MKKLTKKQIELAVDWWSKVIVNPKFDNGADSVQSELACVMARGLVKKISESQMKNFKTALTHILNDLNPVLGLHCDYGPDFNLSKAFGVARISPANAPYKTNMFFRDGKVSVSYGYGAERVELK